MSNRETKTNPLHDRYPVTVIDYILYNVNSRNVFSRFKMHQTFTNSWIVNANNNVIVNLIDYVQDSTWKGVQTLLQCVLLMLNVVLQLS